MRRLTAQDVLLADQTVLIVAGNIQLKGQESTQMAHVNLRTQSLGYRLQKLSGRSLRDWSRLGVQTTRKSVKTEKPRPCSISINEMKETLLAL
jgi:hypothetical protein